MKYNALPTLGISVFNPPAVPCPFSVAAIKNQSIQSQNVIHSSPIPFPVTVFPASPEEHVTMVTNLSGAQTKSTSLAGLPGKATWNQTLKGTTRSHGFHPPFSKWSEPMPDRRIPNPPCCKKRLRKEMKRECPSASPTTVYQSLLT